MAKGHFVGKPIGDSLMLSGVFLVENGIITWQHAFKHAADHPNWQALPALAAQHRLQPTTT
ncbi:MAG: hypothetical protein DYG88_02745 [Chloroflexi bacterium CFX4]|nr:hypothetical protein [Chloroflexi bacterium CFX4]MDL1922570.1 hypothetical protein [Chloroflexi bacterium CFX3]